MPAIFFSLSKQYRRTSNIRQSLVDYKIVDHSDVVGSSPAGTAPTTSSFSNHILFEYQCRSLAQYITHKAHSPRNLRRLFPGTLTGCHSGDGRHWMRLHWLAAGGHSSPFSKRHPTQRGQQFQNFPAHFLPPSTKIASDHTKFAYSPVREPLYK